MENLTVFSINESTTGLPKSDQQVSYPVFVLENMTRVVALLGLLGNFLSFKTADFLPDATSKYIVKYLAVWDTLAALEGALIQKVFFCFIVHFRQIIQVCCFSPFQN